MGIHSPYRHLRGQLQRFVVRLSALQGSIREQDCTFYAPCFTGSNCSIAAYSLLRIAFHRSQSSCSPSQNSADIPRTLASLSAVSGVTPRLPLIISLRRGKETRSLSAKSDWVIAIGFRNSSSSISPGWVGARFRGNLVFIVDDTETRRAERPLELVVVRNFDLICIPVLPTETDSIPLVDANTCQSFPITLQHLQPVAKWHREVL